MMVSNPSLGVGRCHDVLLNVGLSIWRYRKIGHLGARKLKKVLDLVHFCNWVQMHVRSQIPDPRFFDALSRAHPYPANIEKIV